MIFVYDDLVINLDSCM